MDFYLLPKRFLTDLAVNAKSCVNSNVKPYIYQFMIVLSTLGISKRDIEETILLQYPLFQAFSNYQIFAVFLLFIVDDLSKISLEACAAYQSAIDVGLREQLSRVACVYGAAVLDAHCLCGCCIIYLSDAVTDALADLLRLLC